jgi:hypothetical protein
MSTILKRLLIAAVVWSGSACATESSGGRAIRVSVDTREIEGWFSAAGEMTVYPDSDWSEYSPYTRDEDHKCLSLVNDTGASNGSFYEFDRERVVVIGYPVL